jgi:WD40 repeat protein
VPVYATGCERGVHYYAMQFIEGRTLADVIAESRAAAQLGGRERGGAGRTPVGCSAEAEAVRTGPWVPEEEGAAGSGATEGGHAPSATARAGISTERSTRGPAFFRTVAQLGVQAAEALEHAHQLGVVHRDIKPANLLVDGRGRLWVTDFGLAHCQSQAGLTMTGDLVGTLRYMSPEQALAQRVVIDHRTDVYSLGATLYELLALEPAFAGRDRQELLRQIAFEEARPPRRLNRAIPAELETIVLKALEKNPAERYATAQELADDLERFLKDEPIRARRPTLVHRARKFARRHKPVVVTGMVSALLLLGALFIYRLVAAAKINDANDQLRAEIELKDQANQQLENEKVALRLKERQAKIELSTFLLDKGLDSCHQGDAGLGLLWLARSLANAPDDAADLQRVIRTNLAAWHRRVSTLRWVLPHKGKIHHVAFSPDGRTLLTVCETERYSAVSKYKGEVRRWDAATGEPLGPPIPHQGFYPGLVTFSPDRKTVLLGRDIRTAQLWDLETGRPRGSPLAHAHDIQRVVFSADSRTLLTVSGEPSSFLPPGVDPHFLDNLTTCYMPPPPAGKTVHLWAATTGKPLGKPVEHAEEISAVALSPDGRIVLTASGTMARLWKAATGETLGPPLSHPGSITAAAFSPDGRFVLTAGTKAPLPKTPTLVTQSPDPSNPKGRAQLWKVSTGEAVGRPLTPLLAPREVAFSPDGTRVALWGYSAELWCTGQGQGIGIAWFPGRALVHQDAVRAAAFSPDGRTIVTGSHDKTAGLWSAGNAQPIAALLHPSPVRAVAFAPDGRAVITGCEDGTVRLWGVPADRPPDRPPLTFDDTHETIVLSPDGQTLLREGDRSGRLAVELLGARTGRRLGPPLQQDARLYAAAFSPDGRKALLSTHAMIPKTAGPDGKPNSWSEAKNTTLWLWRRGEWERIGTPPGLEGQIQAMAFGPGGEPFCWAAPASRCGCGTRPPGSPLAHPSSTPRPSPLSC